MKMEISTDFDNDEIYFVINLSSKGRPKGISKICMPQAKYRHLKCEEHQIALPIYTYYFHAEYLSKNIWTENRYVLY